MRLRLTAISILVAVAGARVTQERLEMDQPLWPAYHITLEEFEAANGSTLSGWKKDWQNLEGGSAGYDFQVAVSALSEFKSLVVEDPWGILGNWETGRHPCDYSAVLCDQHGVVIGIDFDTLTGDALEFQATPSVTMRMKELPNGPFWDRLGRMSLKVARFSNVRLEKAVLPDWSHFAQLQQLVLANLGLQGALPPSFGDLAALRRLDLRDNHFHGTLPKSWSSMENLEILDLSLSKQMSEQKISSSLPASWEELLRLKLLDLSHQNIHGSLPSGWGDLPALEVVSLANTAIEGALPSSWSAMQNLTTLDLSGTAVTGALPREWGGMQNLTHLDLRRTFVHDKFPSSWQGTCQEARSADRVPLYVFMPRKDLMHSSNPITDASGVCRTNVWGWLTLFALLSLAIFCIVAKYLSASRHFPLLGKKGSYNKFK